MSAGKTSSRVLMFLVAAAICSTPSLAQDDHRFTVPVEPAPVPKQWQEFCRQNPKDCKSDPAGATAVKSTPSAWAELVAVNGNVNRSITPMTDWAHWNVEDRWSYPDDGYGDCEDYALLKRRLLIEAGFPAGALMLTIVWTQQNNGHAVLLVRTDAGSFVLDSEHSDIRHWTQTGYRFVKRPRAGNPNEWVYIDGDSHRPTVVSWSSGDRAN